MGMTEPREMPAETSVPDDVLRSCDQLAEQLQLPRLEVSLEERLRQVLEAVVRLRAERDAAYRSLSSLHAQLVEFDRALADATREARQAKAQRDRAVASKRELKRVLEDATREARQAKAQRDRAVASKRELKRVLEKVWSSKTWRYTAPFRKLYSRCRKVLGRLL